VYDFLPLGCCGEKEFLKLYSYTLTDYPIVVHLDLDSLVLQPFDDLFDSMLNGDNGALPVMHNKSVPEKIHAFYTKDYNMIHPHHKVSFPSLGFAL
jgi:alpha-N-acetylglucosamine transferase